MSNATRGVLAEYIVARALGVPARRRFEPIDDRPAMPALEAWRARQCERPAFARHVLGVPMT